MHELDVIAHVAGIPVEELLPLAYGLGAAWVAVRLTVWRVARRARRRA
jgi:hypothetical protein